MTEPYPHRFWLCWVDPGDRFFVQDYAQASEIVLEWEFDWKEGDFATLQITIKNPETPLLAPGRKRWAWFSFDQGPSTSATAIFFGQVVAVPGNIDGNIITYYMIARPYNATELKRQTADTLRELPWWDKIFIDKQRWTDDDLVLETRAAAWYWNPVTHGCSTSHYLVGEEGVIEFTAGEHDYEECNVTLGPPPIHTAEATAELNWTQQGTGVLDLTDYVTANWPNESASYSPYITSFTMNEDSWFKPGASLKDGWQVTFAEALPRYDLTIKSRTGGQNFVIIWPPEQITVNSQFSEQYSETPPGSIDLGQFMTQHDYTSSIDPSDGEVTSVTSNVGWTTMLVPLYHTKVVLQAGWEASRPFIETVKIVLKADMQPVITMPDESQVFKIQDLRTHNLSEELDPENYEGAPIGDSRRRSYLTQNRGLDSIRYIVLLLRNAIISNSRAARVQIRPYDLNKWATVSLRHNALVHAAKIPSGQALGKVVQKRASYTNSILSMNIFIECCLGRGGTVEEVAGTPEWAEEDYVAQSEDYQQYIGRTLFVSDESDVTVEQPLYDPQDDGLDLIAGFDVLRAIDRSLVVENGPATQRAHIDSLKNTFRHVARPIDGILEFNQELMKALSEHIENKLNEEVPTNLTFALKSMKGTFNTDYELATSVLKLPQGMNLES